MEASHPLDHLWVSSSASFPYNSGLFVDRGHACLIDPGLTAIDLDRLRGWMHAHGAAAAAIVLTHAHWDHLLGSEAFPGVQVLAHQCYPAEAARRTARLTRQVREWRATSGEQQRGAPFSVPQASILVDEDAPLLVGGLTLRLHHAPGHAADHLVVYDPHAAVLWAADMLSELEMPYVCGSLADYERTLERLASWDIQCLVPAHGTPTCEAAEIRSRFAADRVYLGELRSRIEGALRGGRSLAETVSLCGDMAVPCPEDNGRAHRMNVEQIYLELGGAGDPTRVGWGRLDHEA